VPLVVSRLGRRLLSAKGMVAGDYLSYYADRYPSLK
jgi:hypothetical protein